MTRPRRSHGGLMPAPRRHHDGLQEKIGIFYARVRKPGFFFYFLALGTKKSCITFRLRTESETPLCRCALLPVVALFPAVACCRLSAGCCLPVLLVNVCRSSRQFPVACCCSLQLLAVCRCFFGLQAVSQCTLH